MDEKKVNEIYITFDRLPEAVNWKIGQAYRVKTVLRQISSDEEGAIFQIVDATSMEPVDRDPLRRKYST